VFSDKPCGEQARVVTVEDASAGIAPGPSDEVKDYLASKKEERADQRAASASAPADNPPQAPVIINQGGGYGYPVYWPGSRPRPPRPHPRPPVQPELPDIPDSGSVLRPRGQR